MEAFTETVLNKNLQSKLVSALDHKKPFANFIRIIDNSDVRQDWFDFKNEFTADLAKQWLEENAGADLEEKIKALPSVSRKKTLFQNLKKIKASTKRQGLNEYLL